MANRVNKAEKAEAKAEETKAAIQIPDRKVVSEMLFPGKPLNFSWGGEENALVEINASVRCRLIGADSREHEIPANVRCHIDSASFTVESNEHGAIEARLVRVLPEEAEKAYTAKLKGSFGATEEKPEE